MNSSSRSLFMEVDTDTSRRRTEGHSNWALVKWTLGGTLLGTAAAGTIFYLAHMEEKRRTSEEIGRQIRGVIQPSREMAELEREHNCVVCFGEPRKVVFLPCRHFVCCESCSGRLENAVCPKCNSRIIGRMPMFY